MSHPIPSLDSLALTDPIIGVCLQHTNILIDSRIPVSLKISSLPKFVEGISKFLDGYISVDRECKQVFFEYSTCGVLVIPKDDFILILFIDSNSPAVLVSEESVEWLNRFIEAYKANALPDDDVAGSETYVERWRNFHDYLSGMLRKVIASSQSEKLIVKSCQAMGSDIEKGISRTRFRELGLSVIQQIPNHSKRETLIEDLNDYLREGNR